MNKIAFLLIAALCLAYAIPTYSVDVDRSGSASVTLSLESTETVAVPLPPDASNFRIVGGSYAVENSTATVSSGQTGFASFSFSTSSLTSKGASGWKLLVFPPQGAAVRVYLPPYSSITSSDPEPKLVSTDNSRLVFESDYAKTIGISYTLEDPQQQAAGDSGVFLLAAAAVLAAAVVIASFLMRSRQSPPITAQQPPQAAEKKSSLEMTKGKKEMMETFNENDTKAVNYLMSVQGKCRRNELERKSGISKSSLAMALNRLERRKIVEIDRTSTTHFVKLADYFLRL